MTIQFIASRRAGKPVTWFVYAYRGGPRIAKIVAPKKPKLGAAEHAKIAEALAARTKVDPKLMRSLLRDWCPINPATKGSPEWETLETNTKRVWRGHVNTIEARWGDLPLSVWSDPRMVAKVVKWRDERAATPRTADIGITVLRSFLEYARLRGAVALNVATGIPRLYKGGDRAEIIWTADDMERFACAAIVLDRPHLIDGLWLAAMTGLRLADLVSLTWGQIGEFAIVKTALKRSRGKRRRATIPRTPELERLLAELRARTRSDGVETVLVNSRGEPWTAGGFGGSFNRVRDHAAIAHVDETGLPRAKHLHDVRGTFCTILLTECDLTDSEAAEIMAWSPQRVAGIRKVYVDQRAVVVAIGERIAKHAAKQGSEQ